jgi:hypothetical protein
MALTKEQVIDKIEVVENGYLLVRQVTRILEDGNELSKSYHRSSFAPGSDVTGQPSNVQAISAAAWTAEVIAAYQAQVAAQVAARQV